MFSPNKRILIIDDSILTIKILEKYLDKNYMELVFCMESSRAIEMIHMEKPDLVLLDLHMPEISGFDILQNIRNSENLQLREIPVIFITSSEDIEDLKKFYRMGGLDFIRKPLVKEEIVSKIHLHLYHIEEKDILQRYIDIVDKYILMLTTDVNFIILYASFAFTHRTDFLLYELIGERIENFFHEKSYSILEEIKYTLSIKNDWSGIIEFKTQNGKKLITETKWESLFDKRKNLLGFQIILIDVTDKIHFQELSVRDYLTNLYNRMRMIEIINYEIEKIKRFNKKFCLLILDIDDFKIINDTFGHSYGDIVLEELATLLKQHIRSIDYAGRWGGEEFIIVFPETTLEKSLFVANRLFTLINSIIINFDYISIPINTISIGIAECSENDDAKSLVKKADLAMYNAKQMGKNQIQIWKEKGGDSTL